MRIGYYSRMSTNIPYIVGDLVLNTAHVHTSAILDVLLVRMRTFNSKSRPFSLGRRKY